MTAYRRMHTPGTSWFFTVNLARRQDNTLLTDEVARLRAVFAEVRSRHPFTIDAIVVLPEHLHCIWTLPTGDADYGTRWGLIKAGFSRALPATERRSASRLSRGERGIWQRRFWEHQLRNDVDFARHVDYIHWNPVKHGWVSRVADWPYSSFHRFVAEGLLPPDWCGGDADGDFGEGA